MSSEANRRLFIQRLLTALGGASASALSLGLTSCSTLDDYLFEDYYNLKDQVLIIGGGLSGLFLAYNLKKSKTDFRLFEGSPRFGGRIRSAQQVDFGASIYSKEDALMGQLIKEFSINANSLDKNNFFVETGMETVVTKLVERTSGLLPYRNLRLEWQLISIKKVNDAFELLFQTPSGHRTFVSKRVVLAIPPTQWENISGLMNLDEMKSVREWKKTLKAENTIKTAFPYPYQSNLKNVSYFQDNQFNVRQINKKFKNLNWLEIDFQFHEAQQSTDIGQLNEFMKRKMYLTLNYSKLGTENYFDWREVSLIGSGLFKNALPWPEIKSSRFQIVGDFATKTKPYSLEGALASAQSAFENIL